jgi:hypothetical protein
VVSQIGAARHAASRFQADLRKELAQYRLVLLAPQLPPPEPKPKRPPRRSRTNLEPSPLAVPDPRLLHAMDPELAAFVRENEVLEGVVTRELVRDLDSRVLDLRSLLEKSSVQISFGIDAGRIADRSIDRSSGIASVDHLLMEMITLLEKYQLLRFFAGIRRVVASAAIGQEIAIGLSGDVEPEAKATEVRGRLEAGLILWQMLLPPEEADLLKDISVNSEDNRITVGKSFSKEGVTELAKRYYRAGDAK